MPLIHSSCNTSSLRACVVHCWGSALTFPLCSFLHWVFAISRNFKYSHCPYLKAHLKALYFLCTACTGGASISVLRRWLSAAENLNEILPSGKILLLNCRNLWSLDMLIIRQWAAWELNAILDLMSSPVYCKYFKIFLYSYRLSK